MVMRAHVVPRSPKDTVAPVQGCIRKQFDFGICDKAVAYQNSQNTSDEGFAVFTSSFHVRLKKQSLWHVRVYTTLETSRLRKSQPLGTDFTGPSDHVRTKNSTSLWNALGSEKPTVRNARRPSDHVRVPKMSERRIQKWNALGRKTKKNSRSEFTSPTAHGSKKFEASLRPGWLQVILT